MSTTSASAIADGWREAVDFLLALPDGFVFLGGGRRVPSMDRAFLRSALAELGSARLGGDASGRGWTGPGTR